MRKEVDLGKRKVKVVGTSHVSEKSAQEVTETINSFKPDLVGVELDEDRYKALKGDSDWKDLDITEAIMNGKGFLLFVRLVLSIFQRRAGNVDPGKEMLGAIEAAEKAGSEVALVDRDINETFSRARDILSIREKIKLVLPVFEAKEEFDPEELTDYDAVDKLVDELGNQFPGLKTVFLDERNSYMAEKLKEEDFDKAVLVVGAAHFEGVINELKKEDNSFEKPKTNFPVMKAVSYGLPLFILAGIGYSFFKIGIGTGVEASVAWILINGIMALIGSLIATSHPITWITSFLAAPLTSLDPALGAGMVASYVEAKVRPPSVEDLENLSEIEDYRELWSNQAGKVLLTFVLVSMGSAAATFISAGYIAALVGG